jgi:manganese transport protein
MTPYEWYFYSSGAREEGWRKPDLIVNRLTVMLGWSLGAVIAGGLLIAGGAVYFPASITPTHLSQAGLLPIIAFGKTGLVLFLLGALGCVLGASIEVAQSSGHALAQFFGWPWGASRPPREVPKFSAAYTLAMLAALLVLYTGLDPIKITVVSMVFAVIALPMTFFPMLLIANDTAYMGELTNGLLGNTLGVLFLAVLTLCAVAAVPLVIATGGGG